jgi:hypothetical protein
MCVFVQSSNVEISLCERRAHVSAPFVAAAAVAAAAAAKGESKRGEKASINQWPNVSDNHHQHQQAI